MPEVGRVAAVIPGPGRGPVVAVRVRSDGSPPAVGDEVVVVGREDYEALLAQGRHSDLSQALVAFMNRQELAGAVLVGFDADTGSIGIKAATDEGASRFVHDFVNTVGDAVNELAVRMMEIAQEHGVIRAFDTVERTRDGKPVPPLPGGL